MWEPWKPTLREAFKESYTLGKRRETFDGINELATTLVEVWTVHAQRQSETARRLVVEIWLQ
jgi:hypothetical protein